MRKIPKEELQKLILSLPKLNYKELKQVADLIDVKKERKKKDLLIKLTDNIQHGLEVELLKQAKVKKDSLDKMRKQKEEGYVSPYLNGTQFNDEEKIKVYFQVSIKFTKDGYKVNVQVGETISLPKTIANYAIESLKVARKAEE